MGLAGVAGVLGAWAPACAGDSVEDAGDSGWDAGDSIGGAGGRASASLGGVTGIGCVFEILDSSLPLGMTEESGWFDSGCGGQGGEGGLLGGEDFVAAGGG